MSILRDPDFLGEGRVCGVDTLSGHDTLSMRFGSSWDDFSLLNVEFRTGGGTSLREDLQ